MTRIIQFADDVATAFGGVLVLARRKGKEGSVGPGRRTGGGARRVPRTTRGVRRRDVLRGGATVLGAAVLIECLGLGRAEALPRSTNPRLVDVFRLSTHGRRTCSACKGHGANRYFRTREAAHGGRAHLGCNCAIVLQRIPRGLVRRYFRSGDVFDRRWHRPMKPAVPCDPNADVLC